LADVIDIESVTTWPKPIVELLIDSLEMLRNYERTRERIDLSARKDVNLRIYRPSNRFRPPRDALLERTNELLADNNLLGFHCTRLRPDEIASIKRDGLQPLSSAKLRSRIDERIKAGDIPAALGQRLFVEHQADDENRKDMIWFVNSRSVLDDYSGLFHLFRNWGGESLYNSHESDPETGPLLKNLGLPCIVVAALPIRKFQIFSEIGDKIIWSFLRKYGIRTEHSPELEGYMEEPVPPARIIEVVTHGDHRFESLTRSNSWPLSII
jgi:hypothetical protein